MPRVAAVALLVLALWPARAQAIPAFARKYETACGTCHAGVYPELNAWGRRFKENGYQYPAGAEDAYAAAAALSSGERSTVLAQLPLALRAQSTVVVPTDPAATADNPVDFRMLDFLYLQAGAAIAPDVSFMASATLAPSAAIHHGVVGFHNLIFGDGRLNLRVGRLLLLDFVRPEHRRLTRFGYPGATLRVGLNPAALDSTQNGIDVYGRLWRRRLFYELAVVQGAQATDGIRDLDGYKDVFGQLQLTLAERHMVGLLGYVGRAQILSQEAGLVVRFTDPFTVVGAVAELTGGPFALFGQALYGRHANARGTGDRAEYWALRAELDAFLAHRWMVIWRYDQIVSRQETALEARYATANVTYLVRDNVKVSFESTAPLDALETSVLSLRLDLAI